MSNPINIYMTVMDDDESLCRSLTRQIRACGVQLVTCLSAEDFLADTKQRHLDCLPLDLHMPEVTRFDVLIQLVKRALQTPVIVVGGHDEPGSAECARGLGAVGCPGQRQSQHRLQSPRFPLCRIRGGAGAAGLLPRHNRKTEFTTNQTQDKT